MGHSAATVDEARAGYAAGGRSTTHLFNAMSGIDHRAPGSGRRGAPRRRGLRRADRGRHPRPSRAVAAHPASQAGRPAAARQRRDHAGGDGRRAGHDRWPRCRGRRAARHARRDDDARRLGHRARRRRAEPGRRRGSRCRRLSRRRAGTHSRCSASRIAGGWPSDSAPTSSSSTTTSGCDGSCGPGCGGPAWPAAVLVWARDASHPTVVTDWRETNLLSSRTWSRLGFRPTFRRLHRAIA